MEDLSSKIKKFSEDRDWLQFNTPENLAKSIAIESGELLECFQWGSEYNLEEVQSEVADVMNYCILLCSQIGINPREAILKKMESNAQKYPIEKSKGNSKKYNQLGE